MELKYDIYTLNNAQGIGEKRQYVRLIQHEPLTAKELQEKIETRCSLTKGDVAAVLSELHGHLRGRILDGSPFLHSRNRLLLHVGKS